MGACPRRPPPPPSSQSPEPRTLIESLLLGVLRRRRRRPGGRREYPEGFPFCVCVRERGRRLSRSINKAHTQRRQQEEEEEGGKRELCVVWCGSLSLLSPTMPGGQFPPLSPLHASMQLCEEEGGKHTHTHLLLGRTADVRGLMLRQSWRRLGKENGGWSTTTSVTISKPHLV